jgi:hypothetical protein
MPEGKGYGPQDTASVGLNLNVIGNYAYAYSGNITTDQASSELTMISFTTGNFLFVGTWTVCGTVPNKGGGVSGSGGLDQFHLSLNGITVQGLRTETNEEDMPSSDTIPIIIPPFTEVIITAISAKNDASWSFSTALHGSVIK